jgi:Tol biopolymer transport system component
MSWPPNPPPPRRRRRARRPKPPPRTVRELQRQRQARVVWRILAVLVLAIFLPVALAIFVVGVVGRADRPAAVPADFRPPPDLPRARAPLPTDHMLFDSDQKGSYGIYAMNRDGQQVRVVNVDPLYDAWGVRLSPDRLTAVFYRTPAGDERDPGTAELWAVASDGSAGPSLLRPAGLDGWVVQSHAEWDRYGAHLVMSGGTRTSPQIWVTDALGQAPRQITNRPGPNTDPSYTPDGDEVYFVGCPTEVCEPQDRELYRMGANGEEPVRLTFDHRRDREPYVSVAGDRVVWLSYAGAVPGDGWQLRLADRDGPNVRSPRSLLAMAGEDVVGRPQWSVDGGTIYVDRKVAGRATTGIFAIATNSPAGPRELTLGQPGNHEDPSL